MIYIRSPIPAPKNLKRSIFTWSNAIAIASNFIAGGLSLSGFSKAAKQSNKLAGLLTKASLIANGYIFGEHQWSENNNFVSGPAYLTQSVVGLFSKFKDVYLAEGVSTGINLMSLGLNHYDKSNKFDSKHEYAKTLIPNLKTALSELSQPQKLFSKDSGLLTIGMGATMIGGILTSTLSPFKRFGAFARTTAGIVQDLIRLKYKKDSFQFWSSIPYIGAAILDLGNIFTGSKIKALTPLTHAFQRLGGLLSGISFVFEGEVAQGGTATQADAPQTTPEQLLLSAKTLA